MIAARGNYVTIVDMIIKAERFASLYAQSSRDDDVDVREVLKRVSFKPDSTPETQFIRSLLYKLSTKVTLQVRQCTIFSVFASKRMENVGPILDFYRGSNSSD